MRLFHKLIGDHRHRKSSVAFRTKIELERLNSPCHKWRIPDGLELKIMFLAIIRTMPLPAHGFILIVSGWFSCLTQLALSIYQILALKGFFCAWITHSLFNISIFLFTNISTIFSSILEENLNKFYHTLINFVN